MKHGEIFRKRVPTGGGRCVMEKRIKYCVLHGDVDLFTVGGEIPWQRMHGKCDRLQLDPKGAPSDCERRAA